MIILILLTQLPATTAWLDADKLPLFWISLVSIAVLLYAAYYRRGKKKYELREIPGIKAVEEAIGRATEMARPVIFTPGWGGDIQRPTTIASMNFLAHVAKHTAAYDCTLVFPTHDPVIMTVAQEVIRGAYAQSGFADRYREENVRYVSSSQFGYAAAVNGLITRLKPASIFLLGTFEAESLILAETGNSIGAIQIAGTDSTIQLSFFIVACDYTLIGEELFAASGYLSGDESILSSVHAQDLMKLMIIIILIVATFWSSIDILTGGAGTGWWSY